MIFKVLVAALFVAGVFADGSDITEQKENEIRDALSTQCKNVGAPDSAVEDVKAAFVTFINCLKANVDVTALKKEIEEAKPNGALDEVFKKYCAKTPEIKTCVHNLFDATTPCLDETSKAHINSAKNGTDQLIDFVCYKDGDRIALFISEKGPECILEKSQDIRECANKIRENSGVANAQDIKAMTLAAKCGKADELFACVVTALEGCDTPTPGNMAESLFKYVRKNSPCDTALPKN